MGQSAALSAFLIFSPCCLALKKGWTAQAHQKQVLCELSTPWYCKGVLSNPSNYSIEHRASRCESLQWLACSLCNGNFELQALVHRTIV
eukprot:2351961-Amphidinium_carterae.1